MTFLRRIPAPGLLFFFLLFCITGNAAAQERTVLRYAVSYVAASTVYINAGREGNIAAGDTVSIHRGGTSIGTVIVSAVSKRSSSAQIVTQSSPIIAGDEAVLEKVIVKKEQPLPTQQREQGRDSVVNQIPVTTAVSVNRDENRVSGRAGVLYLGTLSENSRVDVSQPSVLLRLSVENLYGTGMVLSMYARTYYDLSDLYRRYGDDSRLKNKVYDLSLHSTDPLAPFGYAMGRMTSEFVGGMGTFDGGQWYYRNGNYTTGLLYGAKVQDRTVGVNGNETKGAFFLNARYGADFQHQYNGTIAYGRQMMQGNLDREFMYLQNFAMMGPVLSVYHSSEFELNDIEKGIRTRSLSMSNTFLSVNYYPEDWLSANVGYDGTRSVYLFETMRSLSDTLLDKNIMQGYRVGSTVRLPYFMSLTGTVTYRTKKGDARDARTISGSYRIADLLGTEIGAGLRYADIVGVYSDGTNVTVDVDRTFFAALSVAARYDYYRYTLIAQDRTFVTHTITVNSHYRLSRSLYTSLAADGIKDDTMNSLRFYAEIGYRF